MLNNYGLRTVLAISAITFAFTSCQHMKKTYSNEHRHHSTLESDNLNFPKPLSPDAPSDVDLKVKKQFDMNGEFTEVQRLFEILSWQNFIALNWPTDESGQPKKDINDDGTYPWQSWKESFEVFQPNGSAPTKWGEHGFPSGFKLDNTGNIPVLFRTSRVDLRQGANVEDEFDQAFTGPIWDQSGNLVRYQVMMNESEFDYVVTNELYNLDGQIAFSNANKTVSFPSAQRHKDGAVEIKLAWKEMVESVDITERYLTTEAYVTDEEGVYSIKRMGLVGMHISMKTDSSPQWIWATFEHVDNVEANSLEVIDGKRVKASFNNPECDICPINVYPNLASDYSDSTVKKNQIQRIAPITSETQALNYQVQHLLAREDSALQYYELVGTQWPTDPSAEAYDVSSHNESNPPALPDAVTNKSGGKPTPVWLTNMVMETYFQGATTGGTDHTLYNVEIANEEAWNQIQGFKDFGTNTQRIFGTESCIGCHYSGAIAVGETTTSGVRTAVFGDAGTSDFSWLLQMKAQFKK